MEPEIDTENGGESLSIEQAADAFAKANQTGIRKEQPETENEDVEAREADDELQESGEDESDEAEGETDDDEQSEDEEGAEPESEGGRFVAANGNVRLPDGTVTTVAKLIDGNLRQSDYTAKTTQVRELERQANERISAVTASEQQVKQKIEYVDHLLKAFTPQPPDPQLLQDDPIAFLSAKENYERMVGVHNFVQQQLQQGQTQAQQQTANERNQKAAKEWETLQDKLPELRTPAKVEPFVNNLTKVGSAYGFNHDELAGALPYDHRFALVLRDAGNWRKLQANKPKAVQQVQGRPPVQKSGKRLTPDAQKARQSQDAINRLKQSGTVDDAAAAYLASMKG